MASKVAGLVQNALTQATPKLNTFLYYARTELTPPKPGDIGAIKNGIQNIVVGFKNQSWKNLTVKQAWLNTLVAIEAGCWFYIGECIGKRHIVGYDV